MVPPAPRKMSPPVQVSRRPVCSRDHRAGCDCLWHRHSRAAGSRHAARPYPAGRRLPVARRAADLVFRHAVLRGPGAGQLERPVRPPAGPAAMSGRVGSGLARHRLRANAGRLLRHPHPSRALHGRCAGRDRIYRRCHATRGSRETLWTGRRDVRSRLHPRPRHRRHLGQHLAAPAVRRECRAGLDQRGLWISLPCREPAAGTAPRLQLAQRQSVRRDPHRLHRRHDTPARHRLVLLLVRPGRAAEQLHPRQ